MPTFEFRYEIRIQAYDSKKFPMQDGEESAFGIGINYKNRHCH